MILPMQKSYTVKEKNPIQLVKVKDSSINKILNFSKSLEVLKGSQENIELSLN